MKKIRFGKGQIMKVNISYLKYHKKLKDNMYATAKPLYKNIDIEWSDMHKLVTSDYIQYSPYCYRNRIKKGINWNNDNQNLLIFDIDSDMTIEEAKNIFKKFKHLITTTKTHLKLKNGIKCDRFRVILPAVNIPIGDLYFFMLDAMRSQIEAIDPQPNCKSGAFLGNSEAINYYNEGEIYDCSKAVEVARYRQINRKKVKQKLREKRVHFDNQFGLDVKQLKSSLTLECLENILESLGYELEGNKFKLRDERTPSCTIFNDCEMKDFGGVFEGDVFNLLVQYNDMTFREALEYVNRFIRREDG